MNILRGIVATILIFVFTITALIIAIGFGVKQTVTPQTAAKIIEQAKAGERLAEALPDFIMQGMSQPGSVKLRIEDIQKFVAEALPADQISLILRSLSNEVISYIRGETDTISKIDLTQTEARAETAAKKIIPGKLGTQMAIMIKQQFVAAGLDKGLEVPRDELTPARNIFAQFRFYLKLALALAVLIFLLTFAVAPHGLRGRLRWCGAALIITGGLSAVVALGVLLAPGLMFSFSLQGNMPPAVRSIINDGARILGGVLLLKILVIAAVYAGSGVLLIILNLILRKRGVSRARTTALENII